MSLRLTPEVVAKEILDAWFSTQYDPKEEEALTYSSPLKQRGFLRANARLCESAETAKTTEAMSVPD